MNTFLLRSFAAASLTLATFAHAAICVPTLPDSVMPDSDASRVLIENKLGKASTIFFRGQRFDIVRDSSTESIAGIRSTDSSLISAEALSQTSAQKNFRRPTSKFDDSGGSTDGDCPIDPNETVSVALERLPLVETSGNRMSEPSTWSPVVQAAYNLGIDAAELDAPSTPVDSSKERKERCGKELDRCKNIADTAWTAGAALVCQKVLDKLEKKVPRWPTVWFIAGAITCINVAESARSARYRACNDEYLRCVIPQ